MTLDNLAAEYFIHCRIERQTAQSTMKKYADCMRSWIAPHLGATDAALLSRSDVATLRGSMIDKGLSVARQYSILVVLKGVLRFGRDVLHMQAIDPTTISLPRRRIGPITYLTETELDKIFRAIPTHTYSGLRLRSLIELLLATGMRIGEALSLDRDVFDAGSNEVEIVGKGRKRRAVFFTDRCYFWIKQYLRKRHDSHPALFVTTGMAPERWQRADISRFFINLRAASGVRKNFGPHTLRHTYCTNLRNRGVDISFIKEFAGHSDIGTTAKYYLGTDRSVLRRIVDTHVTYEAGQT